MATFTQANQNLQFEIPDQGVFRIPGDVSGGVLVRKGNQVFSTNLQDIGYKTLVEQGKARTVNGQLDAPGFTGADVQQAGREYLSSLGYDFNAIPTYGGNVADIQTAFGSAPRNAFQSGLSLTDIFSAKSAPGESLIKTTSATNPNAAIVTASGGEIISGGNAPTFSQAGAINPGNLASYRNPNVDLQAVQTIPTNSLAAGTPSTPNLPVQPVVNTGQQAVAGGMAGITSGATGGATSGTTGSSQPSSLEGLLERYLSTSTPPPSTADVYQSALTSSGVQEKQQLVNNLNAQLNAAVAEANVANLALEQQSAGKDVTSAFLGRQQQEISRQANMKVLPIQAQLAAAQGNLQLAQDQLNTVFKLKAEDAQAQYKYQNDLRKAVFDFATEEQKNLLVAKAKEDDRAFTLSVNNLNNAQSLSKLATENGQYDVAAAITRLNPQSSTFTSDLSALQAQIRPKPTTGVDNTQTDNERALMSQFRGEQIVKDYNEVLAQKGTIDSFINNGVGGPADLALVFSFMKGLDPNSVVRETEYETAAKSGNIFQGAFAKFNGYFKEKGGFLPANVKTEFQNLVNQKLKVKQAQYDNLKTQYEGISARQGLNPQNVVIDYASGGLKDTGISSAPQASEAIFDEVITSSPNNSSGGYWSNLWNSIIGK